MNKITSNSSKILKKGQEILKSCSMTKFAYHTFVNKTDVMSILEYDKEMPLTDIRVRELTSSKNKHGMLKLKQLRAGMRLLDSMGMVEFDEKNDKVRRIIDDDSLKQIQVKLPMNHVLMNDEELLLRASREKGLKDENEFSYRCGNITKFQEDEQEGVKNGIVKAIKELQEQLRTKENFQGRLRIIDIGCGHGNLTAAIAAALPGVDVVGYDTNPTAIDAAASKHTEQKNLRFSKDEKDLKEGFYHMALAINVFHDVTGPEKFLEDVDNILVPKGMAIIADPMVSKKNENNRGSVVGIIGNAHAFAFCVPSNCCENAKGPAMGKEVIYDYMKGSPLEIEDEKKLGGSLFYHAFVLRKGIKMTVPFKFDIKMYINDILK